MLRSAAAVAVLAFAASAQAGTLNIKGADNMAPVVQKWAEGFVKKHPGVQVKFTGGGSGTAIAALMGGSVDIALPGRAMKHSEKEKVAGGAGETAVAKDGLTVYLNDKNPVHALTKAQLKGIYSGAITNWKDVGGPDAPIVRFTREPTSDDYWFFKEAALDGGGFGPGAKSLPDTAAVVAEVAKDANAIGFGGATFAGGVAHLKLADKGSPVAPSMEAVQSGSYPLSRSLFLYTKAAPSGDAKDFIDFCLSPDGQGIVVSSGYFPAK